MNKYRGLVEVKIPGAGTQGFRFGTNSTAIFCESKNIELYDFEQLQPKEILDENGKVLSKMKMTIFIRDLLWSAHTAWARSTGKEEVTVEKIGDWIDEMPQEAFNKIFEVILFSQTFEIDPKKDKKKANAS